jgi:predicted amidohydrolase YtcJ
VDARGTRGGAYASFDEKEKGVLAPGALADFAIIDRDLTRVAPESIRDAHVTLTAVGGRVVYERKRSE